MKIIVGVVGRMKSGPEKLLIDRYVKRIEGLSRGVGMTGFQICEINESRASHAQTRKIEEARELTAKLSSSKIITFDERGKSVSSRQFADHFSGMRDQGTSSLAFLIGGADGLAPHLREQSEHCYAFGAMTLPHQLVRVLVIEQLYRCMTLLTGHPYHRD